MFGFFVDAEAVGGAELTLGGVDNSKIKGTTVFAPTSSSGSTWTLASTRIFVNGRNIGSVGNNQEIIFDSGTSNVLFDTALTQVAILQACGWSGFMSLK